MTLIAGIFVWLLGLCVGSFLNVVAYRLPLGLSVAHPRRSFCPHCRSEVAARDNIPVLSWLLLRGRCRWCRAPISAQYPLVEAATGLTFALIYYLLVIAGARWELAAFAYPQDVPLLAAWLILVAALIVCTVMDFVSYSVDVRVTDTALYAGIVLLALWPRAEVLVPAAASPWAAAAVAAGLVSLVRLWCLPVEPFPPPAADKSSPDVAGVDDDTPGAASPAGGGLRSAAVFGALTFVLLGPTLLIGAAMLPGPAELPWQPGALANPLTLIVVTAYAALFAALVLSGADPRQADHDVLAAVDEEAPQARRTALAELRWLTPALLAGLAAGLGVAFVPALGDAWQATIRATPGGGFVPLAGAAAAIHGAIAAAAAGWIIRIGFTFGFAREAFGAGDIFILAAAGAVAGAEVALTGFVLGFLIALIGWVCALLLKRAVMVPFGPPLALGFLLALWWSRPAHELLAAYASTIQTAYEERPDLLLMGSGVLLVGLVASVFLARLVRMLIERD